MLEKTKKVESLLRQADCLDTYWERYREVAKKPNCDKHDAKFIHGTQTKDFVVFKLPLTFRAHTGYYGNSGCTTFQNSLKEADVTPFLIQALNQNADKLFAEAAQLMRQAAATQVQEAETELQRLQEALNRAKAYGDSPENDVA